MSRFSSTSIIEDSSPPFLDTDPPHWLARGLACVLLLLFVTAFLASVFIHIPETVSGPFTLIPVNATDPVRASHEGKVTQVWGTEGQPVRKGNTLFVLQSEPIGNRSAELATLESQLQGAAQRAINARDQYESQSHVDQEEDRKLRGRLGYLTRTIKLNRRQVALARQLAEEYKKGCDRGVISRADYTEVQLRADRLAAELEEAESEFQETRVSIGKLHYESRAHQLEHRELERSLQEETAKARIRVAALQRELMYSTGDELRVPAPCSGTVLRLRVNTPGAFVQDGEVLSELACSGDRLQGELRVPQSGVAKLRPGQVVRLLYDALPFRRYGMRYGSVRWVGPATGTVGDSGAFRALIDLADVAIRGEGQRRSLMPGMGGRARVVVGRRSLVSYAFEPIRDLRESLGEMPTK